MLIACAFNYDAHASELTKLGPMPILKARMNPDLHMADDLKNTGRGNLCVGCGEPDLVVEQVPASEAGGVPDMVRIRILGVDVFDPQTGDIRSGDTDSIAAWFIDTDYNEESSWSATLTSSAPRTPTSPSRQHSGPRSTRRPGPPSTATSSAPSHGRRRGGSP